MKTIISTLAILFLCLCLSACTDDDNNYDYATLDDLRVEFPASSINRGIGEQVNVIPTITTDIPVSDLEYTWEIGCSGSVTGGPFAFLTLQESPDGSLDYKGVLSELMPAPGTYTLRLHIRQKSNGRNFYSDLFSLTLSGVTGMMVLNDVNGNSDIAVVTANEFRPSTSNEDVPDKVYPDYYSANNGGAKIEGIGKYLTQLQGGNSTYANYHAIIAVTDRTNVAAGYGGLTEIAGGWNNLLFYGGLNRGIPQNIVYSMPTDPMYRFQDVFIFDGGEVYGRQADEFVLRPNLGNRNACLLSYDLAPWIMLPSSPSMGSVQAYLFDQSSHSVLGITNIMGVLKSNSPDENSIKKLDFPSAAFNPANMEGDMVYWAVGGVDQHSLAVMQRGNGEKYIAEFDMTTGTDFNRIPVAIYEMSSLPEIDDVTHYAFVADGSTPNACFYATPGSVYRFTVDGSGSALSATPLKRQGGEAVTFDGNISMLKIIRHQDREMMIVGASDGDKDGKLYIMDIDPVTGSVTGGEKTFSGFGHITDVCLKHL